MPDQSFKTWHVAVNCDHPKHRKVDPNSNDYERTAFDSETRQSYRSEMRVDGWVFHRDGRVTCPECANPQGEQP